MPWLEGFKPQPRNSEATFETRMVSSLINPVTRSWRPELQGELFTPESVAAINKISIPYRPRPDRLAWVKDSKGRLTV